MRDEQVPLKELGMILGVKIFGESASEDKLARVLGALQRAFYLEPPIERDPRADYDPKPVPDWACPGYGHWGHNHKTCNGCVDARARAVGPK